ncbi:hypothetical protein SMACR_02186 [Sordaria macrospora]|uniref:WGS project CABT00000000 data, contig 2.23 n=2 Tax=Sordaria macrospora TaxID=5147 RepID=F7W2W3_SORMK|nr:uncharacterized protein SMAC_02186 [Sordaria macrospora k-hell]KAA8632064.1 hypothetical protein SMACR_02186 [Sordaria macrospora]WPJ63714.1 hypothetical protein SMAC4_02186 [Sordaria macrospora]CCC11964.1 unnamed protein product [Sordaria macrospora k-hell]
MSSTTTLTATKTPPPSRPQLLGTLSTTSASTYPTTTISTSFIKPKKMSITQTYYLAHKARAKLSSEAARPDHNLRLLVGHANLLDSLMVELADAEREQESWFNQSVRGASSNRSEERHIQWADTVVEEPEHDWQAEDAEYSDSDSDSDSDLSEDDEEDRDEDEDIEMADAVPLRRIPSHSSGSLHRYSMQAPLHQYYNYSDDEDMEEDDEEEDYTHLALQRSPSHSTSPPELDLDSDSSEDEHMPPSPPTTILSTFTSTSSEKQTEQTDDEEDQQEQDKDAFYAHNQGYYLPSRGPTLVSTIGVY